MSGYINLHRAIQTHWIYKEDRVFSKFEAWTDILMRVNHTEGKVTHNGTLETVQRGSTIWSLGDMEARWKWSNRKVKRFLDCLVDDKMLAYKSTTKKTYLTVENYDFYQSPQGRKAPPMHQEDTTDAFQKHTNKNVKNEKEKESIKICSEIVSMKESDYEKLVELMTEPIVTLYIERFEEWIVRQTPKEQKTRNPYLSIRNWYKRDSEKNGNGSSIIGKTGKAARMEDLPTLSQVVEKEEADIARSRQERAGML